MKKILFLITFAFCGLITSVSFAQESEVQEQSLDSARSLFDGITGVMVLNIYNNNNFLMDLYSNKLMTKDETIKHAANQVNTIKFILDQIDRELKGTGELVNLKKSDVRYLKELRKALIMLRNQADSLRDYANNVEGSKNKFVTFKDMAWKNVTTVMAKH